MAVAGRAGLWLKPEPCFGVRLLTRVGVRPAALPGAGRQATVDAVSARLFWIGWLFHVKAADDVVVLHARRGDPTDHLRVDCVLHVRGRWKEEGTLLYAALGAGLMGIWSSTLFGSGGAIQWQRWQGTLEVACRRPVPLRVSA